MKNKLIISSIFLFSIFILSQSCSEEKNTLINFDDQNEKDINTSMYGANNSHYTGQNCMNCHNADGFGKWDFNLAGSIYDSSRVNPYANAAVKLYTGANETGILKYIIQVDAEGNFYSTENIDYSEKLYPAVQGPTTTQIMTKPISNGQCNSCHGVSTNKLWAK
jgi:mono/diheme cytochrome c family protein